MKRLIKLAKEEKYRIIIGAVLLTLGFILQFVSFSAAAYIVFALALVVCGFSVFLDAVRGIIRRDFLGEKFLTSVASVGAFFIGEPSEGAIVMLFFLIGEFFEHKAVTRSRNSIKAILNIRPDEAHVVQNTEEITVDCEDVEIGSLISVRVGERVPIDCIVIEGESEVDTSSLTGESIPRFVGVGDKIESGIFVTSGTLKCKTINSFENSSASKILRLVEEATENKSREEAFITRFSRFYTPVVVFIAMLFALIPPIFSLLSWNDAIYRALTFLVISCPCALVISVPLAFFGGIGGAASSGILFKGGNTFSTLAGAQVIAFDKTGTLTTGELKIASVHFDYDDVDELKAYVASLEQYSNHPIAKALRDISEKRYPVTDLRELSGRGAVGTVCGYEIAVGNRELMRTLGVTERAFNGIFASVFVAIDKRFVGCIDLTDRERADSIKAIKELKALGFNRTVMLSGDNREKATAIGERLGIDDVRSELLPAEKYEALKLLKNESGGKVVYVGDGINDAPSIAYADVGIAMGLSGSDSAIEASDVTVMSDSLASIPKAVKISRKTIRIAKENIIFALGVKAAIMILGALGFANMWLAIFADVGVSVIAIINSMRTLRR